MKKEYDKKGIKNSQEEIKEEEFLEQYDIREYESPSVAVDVVAMAIDEDESDNYRKMSDKKLKILLIKRTQHPFQNFWSLPGGFVGLEEEPKYVAKDKFFQKTGMNVNHMEQLYTWGELNRDPRGRIISISYLALSCGCELKIANSEDTSSGKSDEMQDGAKWFEISFSLKEREFLKERKREVYELHLISEDERLQAQIEKITTKDCKGQESEYQIIQCENIAFDHAKIIAYALERLRGKIEYMPIAFSLMPKLFTLTELQQVYEIILGRKLLKANFRRKIGHLVEETDEFRRDMGHRPSKLFQFKEEFEM